MDAPLTTAVAPARSPLDPKSLEAWFDPQAPWQSGFLGLLRAISARSPTTPMPGTARLPGEEPFRISQQPSMAFAPREIASLGTHNGRLDVRLFGLGIWGPQGPLPLHMTELAYSRVESHQDHALVHLVDLFHHRALSQFYRAWASSQATASLDRPDDETFSFYVASLAGIDPAEARRSCLPPHARYSAASHLVREARNPDGVAATLSHHFGVPMTVEEFVPHWIHLPASKHTKLGEPGEAAIMGECAQLGETIPDRQHKFRLVVGPLDLDQYLRLTPHGEDLPTFVEWVRAFVGHEYAWEVTLLVKPHAAPPRLHRHVATTRLFDLARRIDGRTAGRRHGVRTRAIQRLIQEFLHMNAPSPAAILRYAELLEPVSAETPCGPDLEYDPDLVMLLAAAAPRADAQYGNFVEIPPAANWAEIERDCRALLLRTKDIRLAVILLRCRVRLDGAAGLRDGLAFLNALLECYGEALHPLPVLDGERDPVMYANAIAALADPDGALGDARDIAMPKAAGLQLHLRDIEKSFAMSRQKDVLAPESTNRLLKELWGRRDAVVAAFVDAQRLTATITAWCNTTLGADAPDLGALSRILQPFAQPQLEGGNTFAPGVAQAAAHAAGNAALPDTPAPMPALTGTAPIPPSAELFAPLPNAPSELPGSAAIPAAPPVDRWNALAAIQETRMWFELNEPSSPVIVLLRQSERMVGKRFSELAHVIPNDLLVKWDAIDN